MSRNIAFDDLFGADRPKLYRYSEMHHEGYSRLICSEYYIVKTTSKGVWIDSDRWVSTIGTKKRFAYPTKKEALFAYIKRKQRQIKILKNQLTSAQGAFVLANNAYMVDDIESLEKHNQYNFHISKSTFPDDY